ncbi:MAG: cytochrome C [Deltaproteobacteria bacterium]|nr:cytochrome C [Deltaproteobacteria bacterium]
MKRTILLTAFLVVAVSAAQAGLKVIGTGERGMKLDPSGFPPDMKKRYEIMAVKCANSSANCHGLGRAVESIVTGVGVTSKAPFDKQAAKQYGIKMMRKPESNIDKAEAKDIVQLLYYLIDEARK